MATSDRPRVPPQSLPRPSRPPNAARLEKIVIGSLDDLGLGVEAQYNPKELSIERTVSWAPQKAVKGDAPTQEYTGGGNGRSLSLELLFDGFERGMSVQPALAALDQLARVRDKSAAKGEQLRPHYVGVAWGTGTDQLPVFKGVIESISTKITMFFPSGVPARATCAIKIRETDPFAAQRGK